MKTAFRDSRTGREVWRMTNDNAVSFAPYVFRRAFTHDERYLVYSSNASGSMQIWRVALETGETKQLTHLADYPQQNPVLTMDPAGSEALTIAGTKILAVSVETGELRVVADCAMLTGGESPTDFALSLDGSSILISYKRPDGCYALSLCSAMGDDEPPEMHAWSSEIEGVSHVQVCPAEPMCITYNSLPDRQNDFSLSPTERARCWKLNYITGEDEPFLTVPRGFRATHEYWSPDGSRLFFHQKTQPGWVPASIASIAFYGGPSTIHYTSDTIKLGHSAIHPKQTHVVCDSQEPGENPLLLIDLKTSEAETLCWPNASGSPHPCHVHPAFSPTGRYVVYTSDVTGTPQVYIVPLG